MPCFAAALPEPREHQLAVLGLDAVAVVGDHEVDRGLVAEGGPAALEPHGAAAVPHGVLDEVGDDLLEPVGVGPQRAEVVGDVDDEAVTLGTGRDPALDLGLQTRSAAREAARAP